MKARWVAALLCACTVLSGCWDVHETSQLSIVSAFGVDWINGQYVVTAEVINTRAVAPPGQGGGGAEPSAPDTVLYTSHGSTAAAALDDLEHVSSRLLFWPSAHIVIIGVALAERGIAPLLDAIGRDVRFRPTMRVLVATGTAQEILAARQPGVESDVGKQLYLLAQNIYKVSAGGFAPHVYDLMRWDAEEDRDPVVMGVTVVPPLVPNGPTYSLAESAIFQGGRLVAWLPRARVSDVLWLDGQFKSGTFPVACPFRGSESSGRIRLIRVSTQTHPVFAHGRLAAIDVSLSARAGLTQTPCFGPTLQQIQGSARDELRSQVQATIAWAQDTGHDIFGWGETVYRVAPRTWLSSYESRWGSVFVHIPVSLRLRLNLQYTGETLLSGHPRP